MPKLRSLCQFNIYITIKFGNFDRQIFFCHKIQLTADAVTGKQLKNFEKIKINNNNNFYLFNFFFLGGGVFVCVLQAFHIKCSSNI